MAGLRGVSPEGKTEQMNPCQPLDERKRFTGAFLCPERLGPEISGYRQDDV